MSVLQYSWNVTLTIKDARNVENLESYKYEFVAENPFDVTVHVVTVEGELEHTDEPGG